MRLSLLIALGLGILWFVLVQAFPQAMAAVSIFLAIIVSIVIGIILIYRRNSYAFNCSLYRYFPITFQKKNKINGFLFKMVNLMGQIKNDIFNMGTNIHSSYIRLNCLNIFPTFSLYQS